jgi:GT2 family glycosyltransferase
LAFDWLLIGFVRQFYKLFNARKLKEKFPPEDNVWHPDWVSGAVVLIGQELFKKIGRWNEERYWMYHEDPDLCIKVKESGKNIGLLRYVSIKHVGGGTSRKNTKTSIMAKTEVVISSHNYIQVNTKKYPPLLHLLFGLVTLLTLLIKAILSVVILKGQKSKIYFLTALAILKFYFLALGRRTWKSPRLDENQG